MDVGDRQHLEVAGDQSFEQVARRLEPTGSLLDGRWRGAAG